MARDTPAETFLDAQRAIAEARWGDFFACLDRPMLLKIAKNSLQTLLNRSPASRAELQRLWVDQGLSPATLAELEERGQAIVTAAQALGGNPGLTDPEAVKQQSRLHQQRVEAYDRRLTDSLKAVADLPQLAGALEQIMRSVVGGGSVSSSLFQGDTLGQVVMGDRQAWATVHSPLGSSEPLGFCQRRGRWYLRLGARLPRQGRAG